MKYERKEECGCPRFASRCAHAPDGCVAWAVLFKDAAAEFERRLAGLRAEGVPTEGRCECGISFAAGLNGRLFGEVIGPGPQDPEVNCVHVVPMHDASFAHCYDEEDFEEEWADAVTETLSTEHALP